jgi:hypothetical protein
LSGVSDVLLGLSRTYAQTRTAVSAQDIILKPTDGGQELNASSDNSRKETDFAVVGLGHASNWTIDSGYSVVFWLALSA